MRRVLIGAAALLGLTLVGPVPAGAQSPGAAPPAATGQPEVATTNRRSRTPRQARTQREPTAGQMAARERQKKCGAEWRDAKAGGKTGGLRWPQFWSQCNARLKGSNV